MTLKAVTANAGTSLIMLQRHYSHILDRERREAFDKAGFGGTVESTVIPMDRGRS